MACRRLVLLVLLSSAGAAADPVNDAIIVDTAMPGGLHVASADTLPGGTLAVSALGGYGSRDDLVLPGHFWHRSVANLSFAYGITDVVTAGVALDGRYDKSFGITYGCWYGDVSWLGDVHANVRASHAFDRLYLGGQLGITVPGIQGPSLAGSGTSIDVRGLATTALGPVRLSLEAGVKIDRSVHSLADPRSLSLADQIASNISEYDQDFVGALVVVPWRRTWVSAETSAIVLFGSPPGGRGALTSGDVVARAAATAGVRFDPHISGVLWFQLASVPGITRMTAEQNDLPLLPYEPAVMGGAGLEGRFDLE